MRDAYGDWIFDKNKEYRLRVGLQRVPCSFDNWQASRVRMAIDRADSINSCAPSECDMGISFMYSPKIAQARFKQMLDYGYGPGDYGVFHIQVDNSAGLNTAENNKNKRVSVRLAWPWELPGGRLMETGMNAGTDTWHSSMGTTAAGRTLVGLANFYTRWQEYYGGLKFQTGAPGSSMAERRHCKLEVPVRSPTAHRAWRATNPPQC